MKNEENNNTKADEHAEKPEPLAASEWKQLVVIILKFIVRLKLAQDI